MASQRVILGAGLVVLLIVSAASIGLDVESRSDAARVDHTLQVLTKLSGLQLLVRRAESAARGFSLTRDPNLLGEYREASDRITPTFAELGFPGFETSTWFSLFAPRAVDASAPAAVARPDTLANFRKPRRETIDAPCSSASVVLTIFLFDMSGMVVQVEECQRKTTPREASADGK